MEIMGPSHAKGVEHCAKMEPRGCLFDHFGSLKGLLGRSWTSSGAAWATFWHIFVVMDPTFGQHLQKNCNFLILTPLSSGMAVLRGSRAPSWSRLGSKVTSRGGLVNQNGNEQGQRRGRGNKKVARFGLYDEVMERYRSGRGGTYPATFWSPIGFDLMFSNTKK